jgi:hypothetical protein
MLDEGDAVWALVAEVVDAVEADLDVLVTTVEDRVTARTLASCLLVQRRSSPGHEERSLTEERVLTRVRQHSFPVV